MVNKAQEFDIPTQYAVNARRRYLMSELELLEREIAFYRDYEGDYINVTTALIWRNETEIKRLKVLRELKSLKNILYRKNEITDQDIEHARNHDIRNLIDFSHGKSRAWCHKDNNPSLFYASRLGLAICPVCDKKFDSIGVLMDRDGMTFPQAVKALGQGT